ncbi:MAG: hypothetical protein Q7R54_02275 [bacterium]|nr:hypothetical protein [bacterium]
MNTRLIVLIIGAIIVIGGSVYALSVGFGGAPAPVETSVALGEKVVVNDVTINVLELLEDSRCPVDVQCIQAGTVRVLVNVNAFDGDYTLTLGEPQTVEVATITLTAVSPAVKYSTVTVEPSDYRFTFTVQKLAPLEDVGTLSGAMTIGPICPVERIDEPCEPSPEAYAARKVYVYSEDRETLITTLTPDAEGKFSAALPEADYWVDVIHQQIGGTTGVPALIHIKAGATASISIDIDTGIR